LDVLYSRAIGRITDIFEKPHPEHLQKVWKLAEDILHSSTRLLVFGFGFNEYDKAVLELLQEHGKKIEKVLVIDRISQVNKAKLIWPTAKILPSQPIKKLVS
jgi:hypothetical protein